MMVTREPSQYKIPFKACQNSVIRHGQVIIQLNVEWPEKGGDDPKLVVNITDKSPLMCAPQNQVPSSSMLIHHYPQQPQPQPQENFRSIYHPQPCYNLPGSFLSNNLDSLHSTTISSGDHNVSSTTPTSFFDIVNQQPHLSPSPSASSSAAIQQIKNDLKSQLSPVFQRQSTANSSYPTFQNVIQLPSSNMNDSFSDMQLSSISPSSSLKSVSSVTTNIQDPQQSPTASCTPIKSVICHCSNPTNYHEPHCPVNTSTRQQSTINYTQDNSCQPSNNRRFSSQITYPIRSFPTDPLSISSIQDAIQTPNLMSITNCNFSKTSVQSADVTTNVSQQPSYLNNNPNHPTIKLSPFITSTDYHAKSFIFPSGSSPVANYQSNSTITTTGSILSPRRIQTTGVQQPNLTLIEQNIPFNQQRPLFSSLNDCQSQTQVINRLNPLSQQLENHNTSTVLSTHIHIQQGIFPRQHDFQTSTNLPSTNNQQIIMSDSRETLIEHSQNSSNTNTKVRSPVNIDFALTQTSLQTSISQPDIDGVIDEVSKGKGIISVDKTFTPAAARKLKSLSSSKLVWEENGPVTTKTYVSSLEPQQQQLPSVSYDSNFSSLMNQNVTNIAPQMIHPPSINNNGMYILVPQPTVPKAKKRNRTKSVNETGIKRNCKTNVQKLQSQKASPTVTSTSTFNPTSTSPFNINQPTECIPSIDTSKENIIQDSSNNIEQTTIDSALGNDLSTNFSFTNPSEQTIFLEQTYDFDLGGDHSPKNDEHFNPSTPPLPSTVSLYPPTQMSTLTTTSLLTPVSAEKSSETNSYTLYDDFLPSHVLSSSTIWEENQVTSSVVTPPDVQNTSMSQCQSQPQALDQLDSNTQTQMPSSQLLDNTTDNLINQNDNVQTITKSKSKSFPKPNLSDKQTSKISKSKNSFKSSNKKLTCTRCNSNRLADITHHEFSKKKGMVYECQSCGNASLRSNISADERKRRMDQIAADHPQRIECQFCHTFFPSHNDYLMHLKNDHASDKPLKNSSSSSSPAK